MIRVFRPSTSLGLGCIAKQNYFIKSSVSLSINGIYNEPIISEFTRSAHE